MCGCLGNQGLSRSNSGFILHLVRCLVGHHDKCELKLCQKSTWRVNFYKRDKYVPCERVCWAPGVCTSALLHHRDYAYAKVEFWAIFRHTALLVTLGNQALLGEVTVEPDSESQLLP